MKLIFFTKNKELRALAQSIDWIESELFEKPEDALHCILSSLENKLKPVVFLDFDSDLAGANLINSEIYKKDQVIRVVVTSQFSLKDLKEHQSSEHAAHAYIKMPITESIIKSIISDLDISDFIEQNDLYDEGSGFPLRELELNKSHSFSFNRELDVEVDQMISDHELKGDEKAYESFTNQMIQQQFDKVFGAKEISGEYTIERNFGEIDFDNQDQSLSGPEQGSTKETSQNIVYPSAEDLEFPAVGGSSLEFKSERDMDSNKNDNDDLDLELDDLEADSGTDIDLEIDLDNDQPPELELGGDDQDIPSEIHTDLNLELSSGDEVEWEIEGNESSDTHNKTDPTKETFPFEIDNLSEKDSKSDDLSQMVLDDDEEEAYDFDLSEDEEASLNLDQEDNGESLNVELQEEETQEEDGLDLDLSLDEQQEEIEVQAEESSDEGDFSLQLGEEEESETEAETPVFNLSDDEDSDLLVSEQTVEDEGPHQKEEDHQVDFSQYEPKPFEQSESLRFQSLIGDLRDERAELLSQINREKTENKVLQRELLDLKAELEETKIELSIVRQRHQKDLEMLGRAAEIAVERQRLAEEKLKHTQREFHKIEERARYDIGQVRHREKELESQLELVKMDTESQVELRDRKILELKRKIDQLEFNMENSAIREQKSRDDKYFVEQKLEKIMKTLRGSIELLEDDIVNNLELNASKKKNEDLE